MSLSRSLRLMALTLFSTFLIATLVHGSAPAATPQSRLALVAGTVARTISALQSLWFGESTTTSPEEREKINKILDEHYDEVQEAMREATVTFFDWLPGYLVKKNTTRLAGVKVLSDCIKTHKLKYVTVPEKWLYCAPKQYEPSITELIIAKQVKSIPNLEPINLAQAQDIIIILKHAKLNECNYSDTHLGNLFHQADGCIVFIDTEQGSFGGGDPVNGIKKILKIHSFTPNAKLFMQQELTIAEQEHEKERKKWIESLGTQ